MSDNTTEVVAAPVAIAMNAHSYVDWCAIAAGTTIAAAISILFVAFGSAVGLTLVSPFAGEGTPIVGMAIASGLWLLWVNVSSFLAGGYITGRMRRRVGDATEHESDVRDGSHGLLAWALGVVLLAVFAAASIGAATTAATVAVGSQADEATSTSAYYIDRLLRPGGETEGEPAAARDELGRLLARSTIGAGLGQDDRSYAARLIATQTGIPQAEAEQRLDRLIDEARIAAEKARKFGILAAFLMAASLLVGAVASWWAAQLGGRHRDQGTVVSLLTRW